jgi:hypothetical protein
LLGRLGFESSWFIPFRIPRNDEEPILEIVIPAQAGIQRRHTLEAALLTDTAWIPAFAGMTLKRAGMVKGSDPLNGNGFSYSTRSRSPAD